MNSTFSTLSIPIDIIWGEEDGLISKESVYIMKILVPHAKEHFIPKCGHVPQLEQSHELVSILKDILGSYKKNEASV